MKVSIALVFACLVVIGHVAAHDRQKRQIHSCKADSECSGRFCFCVKPQHHHYGECICNMDPDMLKPRHNDDIACFAQDDCKNKGPHCYCKKPQNQYFGTCECIAPLLG